MIKDEVKVKFVSGKGGDGGVKFGSGSPKRPTGGIGGNGGDVYIEGSTDVYDYGFINEEFNFQAEDGQPGGVNMQRGGNGKDITIKLPLISELYDEDNKLITSVTKVGERILLVKGGDGGLGNHYFRRGFEGRYDHSNPGDPGIELKVTLKLKLVADIVFIGFPNAGKSSMINALTRANVKVGNYPFTTLSPHLGRFKGMTLMDLPGLIEGTSTGKGLGTKFIKHTEYAKLVAHFISLESDDLLKDYSIMRKELKDISENLYNMKEIILLTKSDSFSEEEIKDKVDSLKSINIDKVVCSAFVPDSLKEVERVFIENLKTNDRSR